MARVSTLLSLFMGSFATAHKGVDCCAKESIVASCFGYSPTADNSAALTAAIQSCGNASFTIDFVPGSSGVWPTLPLFLNASNQVVTLAENVTLQALRGAYHRGGDCLVSMTYVVNVSLVGAGAGAYLEMWQADYNNTDAYNHSEWRHGVRIGHADGVSLSGVTISYTGGDGVDIGDSAQNVVVKNVHTVHAYRNGMSVTGVTNLTVVDSSFVATAGTCCEGGLDIEPGTPKQSIQGVYFKNVTFAENNMAQVTLSLYAQEGLVDDVTFEDVEIFGHHGGKQLPGLWIVSLSTAMQGRLAFTNVRIHDLGSPGLIVERNGSSGAALVFTNVT